MTVTVLIADDDVDFTDLIRSFLERYAYQVVAVWNGQEAIDYVSRRHAVNAILLDVMMPRMDGWEACRRLRELTDAPILMLTALGGVDDIEHGLALGADDYLVKPFDLRALKARLDACLRRVYPSLRCERR